MSRWLAAPEMFPFAHLLLHRLLDVVDGRMHGLHLLVQSLYGIDIKGGCDLRAASSRGGVCGPRGILLGGGLGPSLGAKVRRMRRLLLL